MATVLSQQGSIGSKCGAEGDERAVPGYGLHRSTQVRASWQGSDTSAHLLLDGVDEAGEEHKGVVLRPHLTLAPPARGIKAGFETGLKLA